MKIACIHEAGGPDKIILDDVPVPAVSSGQVRIKVLAASINPVDWKLMSGKAPVPIVFPHIPGGDVAGVIDALGEGVDGYAVGDEVFALIGLFGAYSEQVVVDAGCVARKPANIDFAEAASLPLVALTAWQGFLATGDDLAGKRVLIHNAAGGVGSVAVQIAKAKGAWVLATASAKNRDYVAALGADEIVDFREVDASSRPADIDIMMDLVGTEAAMDLWRLIRPGGAVVRIAGGADAALLAEKGGIRAIKTRVKPDGSQLSEIADLVTSGVIRTHLSARMPFAQAEQALEMSRTGHVSGKIVLEMS